jgi:PAS domain S-box-containing protein
LSDPAPKLEATRNVLRELVAGLTDGIIVIEPNGVISWANDSALAMHRIAAIGDLGETVAGYRRRFSLRYRNNHLLDKGQYPLERLQAGETFDSVTIEISPVTESELTWVHAARGLVIDGIDGQPALLALILRDETPLFEAEERFERSFNANPAPGLICRLEDQRFIRVNQGFIEMTGYTKEQVVGQTVEDLGLFENCETGEEALIKLAEGRVIRHREALVPLPAGGDRMVMVAGEPIAVQEEPCMLFTFADLDARRRAQNALRQSEERFSKSFRQSPSAAAITRLEDFAFMEANAAFLQLTGLAETELLGKSPSDIHLFADVTDRRALERMLRDNEPVQNVEARLSVKGDGTVDCLVSAERVEMNDQQTVIWSLQDVTDRKRTEDELVEAIGSVMADTSWFGRSIVERLAAIRQKSKGKVSDTMLLDLTERERQILGLICEGMGDAEMAAIVNLSKNTIRNHVSSLYSKIGVNRRTAAVAWARDRGFSGKAPSRT